MGERTLWLYAHASQLNPATTFYIDTLARAAAECGFALRHTQGLSDIPPRSAVLTVESKSAAKALAVGRGHRVWLWMQGIFPEEARLQFGGRADGRPREWLWNQFDRWALPRLAGLICVSDAMAHHLRRKWPRASPPVTVLPCANARIDASAFTHPGKYQTPSFVYAGSLHAWQCFEQTLDAFRAIRQQLPQATLTIYTSEVEGARARAAAAQVPVQEITQVPLVELQARLAAFKYGFVLRQDHVVNRVATPTKVSSYMAAGVIPVMPPVVDDYVTQLKSVSPFVWCRDTSAAAVAQAVLATEAQPLQAAQVLDAYGQAFRAYFDHDRYHPALVRFFRQTGLDRHVA